MTWLLLGGGLLVLLWLVVRLAKSSGRKAAQNDAYEEAFGDVTTAKKARDRLADPAERVRVRKASTR
jgi:hypothetical protein